MSDPQRSISVALPHDVHALSFQGSAPLQGRASLTTQIHPADDFATIVGRVVHRNGPVLDFGHVATVDLQGENSDPHALTVFVGKANDRHIASGSSSLWRLPITRTGSGNASITNGSPRYSFLCLGLVLRLGLRLRLSSASSWARAS